MRWPSSPGKGGFSSPGSSRPSLTHWTIRTIVALQTGVRGQGSGVRTSDRTSGAVYAGRDCLRPARGSPTRSVSWPLAPDPWLLLDEEDGARPAEAGRLVADGGEGLDRREV